MLEEESKWHYIDDSVNAVMLAKEDVVVDDREYRSRAFNGISFRCANNAAKRFTTATNIESGNLTYPFQNYLRRS